MKPVIKNGVITHYEEWNGQKHGAEEVFKQILKVQKQQLSEWREKLSNECFDDLQTAVYLKNEGMTAETHNAYNIKRGTDLDNFIANWRPGKPINEIYW